MEFTKEELITIERLLIQNRDSKRLQDISNCSYLDSIELIQKTEKILERKEFYKEHDELVDRYRDGELTDKEFWDLEKEMERKYNIFEYLSSKERYVKDFPLRNGKSEYRKVD